MLYSQTPHTFFLVLSSTKTSLHPGISSAGASPELLKYTAALDAEYLEYGETKTLKSLPVSPSNIYSPAIISKACLNMLGIKPVFIDAGTFVKPQVPYIDTGAKAAESVETGQAMTLQEVIELFHRGSRIVKTLPECSFSCYAPSFDNDSARLASFEEPELCKSIMRIPKSERNTVIGHSGRVLIGECVVGGTTTALGLLTALGYNCNGMMSSSLPNGNHELKRKLVEEGYRNALLRDDFNEEAVKNNPLLAVSAMGDPMQAVVAGMAIEFMQNGVPVMLAGGSQMIAVACLIERLFIKDETSSHICQSLLSIGTTPWVINDKSARITELHKLTCKHTALLHATIDSKQIHGPAAELFAAYEQGHVKEGVGAGALMLTSLTTGTIFFRFSNNIHSIKLNKINTKRLCIELENLLNTINLFAKSLV